MSVHSSISVVITCYNLEKFIGEAIGTVLAQRDPGNVEIIVVDDCSTDRSADAIQSFDAVTYVRTPSNGGVLLAMLEGVARARNDIICLLDGDDLWEPGKLVATRAAFENDARLALATHDLQFVDGEGRVLQRRSRPAEVLSPLGARAAGDQVRRGILELQDYVWLGSALSFRRTLARWDDFAEFARQLPDPRNCYQDWPLAYWIAALPDVRLGYVAEPLFRYRLHGQNHSGDARTVQRALRNLTRTWNTREAIAAIAERRELPPKLRRIARQSVAIARAQVDLYSGRKTRALRSLFDGLPLAWRDGLLGKEVIRFLVGTLLGTAALIRLRAPVRSAAPET
jgi:glycosyltransferase involved in cell wall biosynthesis